VVHLPTIARHPLLFHCLPLPFIILLAKPTREKEKSNPYPPPLPKAKKSVFPSSFACNLLFWGLYKIREKSKVDPFPF